MSDNPIYFDIEIHEPSPNRSASITASISAKCGHPLIPNITESQLDGYVNKLIEELELIRKKGREDFAQAKKRLG